MTSCAARWAAHCPQHDLIVSHIATCHICHSHTTAIWSNACSLNPKLCAPCILSAIISTCSRSFRTTSKPPDSYVLVRRQVGVSILEDACTALAAVAVLAVEPQTLVLQRRGGDYDWEQVVAILRKVGSWLPSYGFRLRPWWPQCWSMVAHWMVSPRGSILCPLRRSASTTYHF